MTRTEYVFIIKSVYLQRGIAMKVVKKGLSLFLALLMVFGMIPNMPLSADAAETVQSGVCGAEGSNVTWALDDEGLLTISGTGEMMFSESTCWDTYTVERVIIEEGITNVDYAAFQHCSNIVSVSLPSTLTEIEEWAFSNCWALETINIPYGVTNIGMYAFYACSSLKNVVLPETVEYIGEHAFSACDLLETIEFLGNPPQFGDFGMAYYSNLIKYPCSNPLWDSTAKASLTGTQTWAKAHKFENGSCVMCDFPDGHEAYGDCGEALLWTLDGGVLTITGSGDMQDFGEEYYGGVQPVDAPWFGLDYMQVVLPEALTSIGINAFAGSICLEEITIPAGVGLDTLRIAMEEGTLVMTDITANSVTIQSGGGNLIMRDVSLGTVDIYTDAGEVALNECTFNSLNIGMGDGAVTVDSEDGLARCRMEIKTGDGEITYNGASQGSQFLQPGNGKRFLTIQVGSGDISISG